MWQNVEFFCCLRDYDAILKFLQKIRFFPQKDWKLSYFMWFSMKFFLSPKKTREALDFSAWNRLIVKSAPFFLSNLHLFSCLKVVKSAPFLSNLHLFLFRIFCCKISLNWVRLGLPARSRKAPSKGSDSNLSYFMVKKGADLTTFGWRKRCRFDKKRCRFDNEPANCIYLRVNLSAVTCIIPNSVTVWQESDT